MRVRSRLQFSKIDFVLVDAKAAVMIFDVDYGVVVICGLYGSLAIFFSLYESMRNYLISAPRRASSSPPAVQKLVKGGRSRACPRKSGTGLEEYPPRARFLRLRRSLGR